MSPRNTYARYVLLLFFICSAVLAVPMLFFASRATRSLRWYPFDPLSTKMLGAALAALGVGALLAMRDPLRHRVIVQIDIVYTAMTTVVLIYREARFNSMTPNVVWFILGFAILLLVLLSVTYPAAEAAKPAAAAICRTRGLVYSPTGSSTLAIAVWCRWARA